MVDNMPRGAGDLGRPPQALSPSRAQPGPQDSPYLTIDSGQGNNNNGSSPRTVEDDLDFQLNNMSLLKAQLKLVTHERDMLKKDIKKISMERDGAFKHLSLTGAAQAAQMMEFVTGGHHHHRTASDTASGASTSKQPGHSSTLSRSHSIASAGDKSLILSTLSMSNASSPSHQQQGLPIRHPGDISSERLLHELQIIKKQHGDALKKCDQTMKDAEYYHAEAESMRSRYNEIVIEKQRLEQEVNSLRMFVDEERKEMADLRRQQQEVLNAEGGESLSLMYSQLLQNYENVKDDFSLLRKRYDDLVASHSAAVSKLEHTQEEIGRYKKLYSEVLNERNQFKQQCTQAIRQWDQTLRERNEYKEALAKVKRQHDDAIKEINQAMTVRIKASKDLKRLTEERNAAMQEYSLIMSERDSVHKEIEKLQEDIKDKNKKLISHDNRSKHFEEEKRKLNCKIEMLKRELEQSMHERDRAMRESHDLREKIGGGKASSDHDHYKNINKHRFGDSDKSKKDRDFASTETIDTSLSLTSKKDRLDNLDQANAEIEKLRKLGEKLTGELQEATMEADVAKGRRDWAFSERDKVVLERESIRTLCDKLRRERDRAVSELAEALRDSDDIKKERNETQKENKELRERLEVVEKNLRLKSLQRSPGGHSHSHDSAIDSDLQEWNTEALDIDMNGLGSTEDLMLDLAGGRDDLHCPNDKPIYVSSIAKGSFLDGKLKVNDCILRINNIDCRDIDRRTLMHTLKSATSTVNLLIKRRRPGKRYTAILHLNGGDHGLTLELGAYVAKIQPGSAAAKEGSIAIGDRIIGINDQDLDHLESIGDALKLLDSPTSSILSVTLAKSVNNIMGQALSTSSSGHNMQMGQHEAASSTVDVTASMATDHHHQPNGGKKSLSATTSPIKDTIRGSQEMIKKFINSSKERGLSSSSSEKVYSVNSSTMKANGSSGAGSSSKDSSKKLIDTVKEKFDHVTRGKRRSSKEPLSNGEQQKASLLLEQSIINLEHEMNEKMAESDKGPDMAIAELDSVINSYHSGSSGTKSSGNGKKKRSKERDSFCSGGTWPRTRGGPIIEHGTGTILHPQKMKKERLPLAELLSNLPKYPPEGMSATSSKVAYRANDAWSRSTREHNRRSRPVTTYDMLANYASTSSNFRLSSDPSGASNSMKGAASSKNEGHDLQKAYLSPSDTSIDESVKSAQAGKDVLEQYLKRSKNAHKTSNSGLPQPSATSSITDLIIDPSSVVGSPPPPMTLPSHYFKSSHDYSHLIRPGTHSGFSPYYNNNMGMSSSSPRYSTPPLPSESLLGSPIPDYAAGSQQKFYHHLSHYESGSGAGPQAPPSQQPHSLSSISPTSGLYHHRGHSPSQGMEYLTAKSRGGHYGPIPPYSGYPGYPYPAPPPMPAPSGASGSSYNPVQQQHPGYHRPSEETSSPPPVYEYLSSSRRGDNFSGKFSDQKIKKSGTYPRKRRERDPMPRQSPKSASCAKDEAVPIMGNVPITSAVTSLNSGNGSSGTEKDQRSSGSGKGRISHHRRRQLHAKKTLSSSSSDEEELSSKPRGHGSKTHKNPASSRENLLYKSSTTPRNAKMAGGHANTNSSSLSRSHRHRSSENILDEGKDEPPKLKGAGNLSEGEILDKVDNFDFTSSRKNHGKNPERKKKAEVAKNQFGSTEFPTLKRKPPAFAPAKESVTKPENDYESMTSLIEANQHIRSSTWTPEACEGKTTADGLSSPSVMTNADQDKKKAAAVEAIEPPPNFGSPKDDSRREKPPPLPAKKHKRMNNPEERKKTAEIVIQPSQIRMTAAQVQQERYYQQRNKRIRNRSLEMVLDDSQRSSDSSPSRQSYPRDHRPSSRDYTRSLERPKPRRFDRIPSNTSVASQGSASTCDRPFSKCSSPLPIYSVQYLLPDGRAEHQRIPRKPHPGEIRQIYIEKSSEALGITIKENPAKKGVFVSSVSENSLANQVGLQIGDQLLDVCGVNLRACGKEQAALVLQNSGNSITMKVQFNPVEYHSMLTLNTQLDDEDLDEDEVDSSDDEDSSDESRQDSPTPRNSPRASGRGVGQVALPDPGSIRASLRAYEPRLVFPVMKKSGDLGVRLVGGNAVGIFIHSVDPESGAYHVGLRCADQILEYNGVDLRSATAEQAAYELAKPADKVAILVQYNPEKYEVIKDQPGDSYYVRALFDRLPDPQSGPHQLSFRKDDILFIDNTMYNGIPGHWSAWIVDLDGQRGEWGIVPSKYKVDEELLKRSIDSDSDPGSSGLSANSATRKTWTATRRSFFKRRKGGRSSSRDSSAAKELASFSDMASLNYADSGSSQVLHEVEPSINSYVRVERLDYMVTRPVLIIGPLNDVVTDKLMSDYPFKFARCEPEFMNCTQEALEKGILNNIIVDFRRRGSQFECYTVSAIKDICDRNQHCILNIHMDAVERLHQNQIYPIVLLIKFKSVKQIKEIKDPRYLAEKISQKDAKNMFESTQTLESDYRPYISDTIHAGANLMLMCAQIASKIDQEQNKTLWVPSGTIW